MGTRSLLLHSALLVILDLVVTTTVLAAEVVDHGKYARLLSRHVHAGKVDYQGFKKDEAMLNQYLDELDQVNPDALDRTEAMAFYINLYNAWTIKLILSKFPDLKSIKDLGGIFQSPWKKKIVRLNGQKVSLDHIEQDILRPRYKDPRVHFAVNCASKSCPPLISEPYEGQKLDDQLNKATEYFINDPTSNYLKGDTLYVSRIFKWYVEDFQVGIIGFFRKFARGDLLKKLQQTSEKFKIDYLDYDWTLNSIES